jgi:hypothetical protein
MRVLVMVRPKFPVPPEQLPGMVPAFEAWRERYRDRMESFDFFVGGGGCGIVNFPDELSLNQFYLEFPFSFFSDTEIIPLIPGDAALAQFKGAVQAMMGQQPAS